MPDEPKTIDARPTKHLFIRMLIKDVSVIKVIPDLVDNCVDGARRIREDEDFSGLWVRIEATRDRFRIADNCGGISVELAEKYAFRFGRPEDMPSELQVPHSTGQFGIGMKRALFKLGTKFKIQSQTDRSRFVVKEDVEKWAKKRKWEFRFAELDEELEATPQPDERGTVIEVTPLHDSVAEDFALDNFLSRLKVQLEAKHQDSMKKGLAITLNGIPLQVRALRLLYSDELKPAYRRLVLQKPESLPVTVMLYAGVSVSSPPISGWHIYCNGRLILEADKSHITGWGDGNPRHHPQYNRFRGYVFFDSDDVTLLPWNTTKDGVDEDSPIFRAVRLVMIKMMRTVIDFLNQLDAEKERDERPLETTVKTAKKTELSKLPTKDLLTVFVTLIPEPVQPRPKMTRISYSRPAAKVEAVKEILGARSNKQVGETTFDLFFETECED